VSGCDDGSVRVWDAATGRELGALLPHGVVVYSDGSYALSGEPDGEVWWSIGARRVELADLEPFGRGPEPLRPLVHPKATTRG
jgi:hypothetical protein